MLVNNEKAVPNGIKEAMERLKPEDFETTLEEQARFIRERAAEKASESTDYVLGKVK